MTARPTPSDLQRKSPPKRSSPSPRCLPKPATAPPRYSSPPAPAAPRGPPLHHHLRLLHDPPLAHRTQDVLLARVLRRLRLRTLRARVRPARAARMLDLEVRPRDAPRISLRLCSAASIEKHSILVQNVKATSYKTISCAQRQDQKMPMPQNCQESGSNARSPPLPFPSSFPLNDLLKHLGVALEPY